jgi:uncharacterized protein
MTTPTNATPPSPRAPDTTSPLGRFVWADLMTPDADAAVAFYTEVVGWTSAPSPASGERPYTLLANAAGVPVGGIVAPDPAAHESHAYWMAHVATPDVDATTRDAKARGANVCVAPVDIPGVGRYSIINDPQGGTLALFQSARGVGPMTAPGVGDVAWYELAAGDADAAMAFHGPLLAWTEQRRMDMGPMGPYVLFGQGARDYGGMMRAAPGVPPHWRLYFGVSDLEAAMARAAARGATLQHGPIEVPGGDRVAMYLDPQGAPFALHVPKGR